MTLLRLPDEINQVTDQIPAGTRFRSCDILPMLRRRHNGVRLTQIGGWLARRDDIRKVNNDGLKAGWKCSEIWRMRRYDGRETYLPVHIE